MGRSHDEAALHVQANKYQRASSGSSDDERSSPTRVPLRSAADNARANKRAARFGDGRAAGTAGGKLSGGAKPWASAVRKDMFQMAAGDSAVEDYNYDAFIIKVSPLPCNTYSLAVSRLVYNPNDCPWCRD